MRYILKRDTFMDRDYYKAIQNNAEFYLRKYPVLSDKNISKKGEDFVDKYILSGWLPDKPFILKSDKIIAFGSCFAYNLTKYLKEIGYGINNGDLRFYFYSDEFVNVFSINEQIKWMNKEIDVDSVNWFEGETCRNIPKKEILGDEEREKMFQEFSKASSVIITFGLSEIWIDKNNNRVFWGKTDVKNKYFKVATFEETKRCIFEIYSGIRKINKECKIIFSLSPVPLLATFRPESVITANCVSKSILRSAIDELYRDILINDKNFFYWPSYEIVMYALDSPYEEDGRHIKQDKVRYILEKFKRYYLL